MLRVNFFPTKTIRFSEDEFTSTRPKDIRDYAGCSSLYTSINLNPSGQILACCGFASEYSPLLKLGDLKFNAERLDKYLDNVQQNFLFTWLYVEGPRGILSYLESGKLLKDTSAHECEVCFRILANEDYLKRIANISQSKIFEIMTRLEMKCKLQNVNYKTNENEKK